MTEYESKPTTGVWWDINTCLVPGGYDPRRVRPSIEAALFKLMGPHPVVIYCVGNLEYISRTLLEEISSSGIRFKHTPFGGVEFIRLLRTWCQEPGHPSTPGRDSVGFVHIRPGPEPLSTKVDCPSEKWLWKDLLEETCEEPPLKIRSRILEYEKPFYCRVCMFYFSSFDVFISHFKSRQHNKVFGKQLLLSVIPFDINNYTDNTCTLCQYPYYNDANRKLHFNLT
ncbi:hypothetical protein YC2023_093619 [Brassica napus]